jgi:hypothetical protein
MPDLSRSEVKRLGKRGSYRFGWLRVEGPEPRPLPAPRQPTFRRRRLGSKLGWVFWCCAAAAALWAGASRYGLWWLPLVAGLLAGLRCARARSAVLWVVLAVCAGWGVALWWPPHAASTVRVVTALARLAPNVSIGAGDTLLAGVVEGIVTALLARLLHRRRRFR